MPIHNWSLVEAGIFHNFHQAWITTLTMALNAGLSPPKYYALAEQIAGRTVPDVYAAMANRIAIRHISDHRVIAIIEIVSPGNKDKRSSLRDFVEKSATMLIEGIHLLVIDLFSPSRRDPQGIHKAIWDEIAEVEFTLPADRPLTLASYVGGLRKKAYIEPIAVHGVMPDMPLFLTPNFYVPTPLEATYQSALSAVPAYWRKKLEEPL